MSHYFYKLASTPESIMNGLMSALPAYINSGNVPEVESLGNLSFCGPLDVDMEDVGMETIYKVELCIEAHNLVASVS